MLVDFIGNALIESDCIQLIKYIEDYKVNIIISASINDIETAELISNNKHVIYYNTDFEIFICLCSIV